MTSLVNEIARANGDPRGAATAQPALEPPRSLDPDALPCQEPDGSGASPSVQSLSSAPDPFDPASLRLDADFGATLGVTKETVAVAVRKPANQEYIRVRAGEGWQLETAILEDGADRATYLVHRSLRASLATEIRLVCLVLAINRENTPFLWALKLPGSDGRTNRWHSSAIAGAKLAESRWSRIVANMSAGQYDVFTANGELPEPTWPDLGFRDILEKAFSDRLINDRDHPVLRRLRGEV